MFSNHNGRALFKALNALGGIACVLIGIFLPHLDFIFVFQSPGDDAYKLIQAHWIAAGVISLLVARSNRSGRLSAALLLAWLMLNGWIGGKALLTGDPRLFWTLGFPVLAILNYAQLLVQDEPAGTDEPVQTTPQPSEDEPSIPADVYELKSASPLGAVLGVFQIILTVALQIILMVLFFFYGTLLTRILFEGASLDFSKIPGALGGVFWKLLYIPIIVVAVYSIVFLIQILVEKLALNSAAKDVHDVNRALSLPERKFIEGSLQKLEAYLAEVKYPAAYGWIFWPSVIFLIGAFIVTPLLIVFFEAAFFNAVRISGVPAANVISSLGPAFVGGAVFGFLFGSIFYWALFQWLGMRRPNFGEFLHAKRGWNSMNSEARSLDAYAKILTRFVRKRRYSPDQAFDASQFIRDAFAEFAGFVYKSAIVLGIATVLFTTLDVNWMRVVHTGGIHYSPYLDLRSHDLTLDDVVKVELRCFLYDADDDGERSPGVGYDVVFSNGMRGYLLEDEDDAEVLAKVEAVDAQMRRRGVPFVHAKHAGPVILRGVNGYWPDCRSTVLPKLEADIRPRIAALLRVDSAKSAPEN